MVEEGLQVTKRDGWAEGAVRNGRRQLWVELKWVPRSAFPPFQLLSPSRLPLLNPAGRGSVVTSTLTSTSLVL